MENRTSTGFSTHKGLGYIPLDDAIELYYFQSLISVLNNEDEEEKEKKTQILIEIGSIVERYLNPKEQCIYNLVIHEHKKTADIATILNYNGWRTTQNSIDRVFKIIKLYYDYEKIDHDKLKIEIQKNFSKLEQRVIKLLHERNTIQKINKRLGSKFHYAKTQSIINGIMEKLSTLNEECQQYKEFLVSIRRFKDSCNFDEKSDRIKYL